MLLRRLPFQQLNGVEKTSVAITLMLNHNFTGLFGDNNESVFKVIETGRQSPSPSRSKEAKKKASLNRVN